MNQSRIKNTKRNIVLSYAYAGIDFVFKFVSRSVIVIVLGEQYLGLSSLCTSILSVLNMAELGFSGAIVYNMYKPLAENNKDVVCALLNYYKHIYRVVGTIILFAGLVITPFIPAFIKGTYPKDTNIYIVFILFLINTSVSYFLFAYKSSLVEAAQRMDLSKAVFCVVGILQYAFQLFALIIFKSFYLFIIGMIVGTALRNIVISIVSNKVFPQYQCSGELSIKMKKDIIGRVKGLMICSISSVTYTTFDSIILSTILGLSAVAKYTNYITVYTGVTTLVMYIRQAMQHSVGNSIAVENRDKNYKDLLIWQFLFSAIALVCATCMFNLFQPFISIWMGPKFLLPERDVLLICFWFAINVVQHAYFLYLAGNGMWWELRWPYIFSTVFNLVFNIVFGKLWGVTGIILASVIASLFFCLIWQSKIILREYFKISAKNYLFKQLLYFVEMVLACLISAFLCKNINAYSILGLIERLVVSVMIALIVLLLTNIKNTQLKKAVSLMKTAVKL